MIDERLMKELRIITPEERSILDGVGVDKSLYMDVSPQNGVDVIDSQHLLANGKLIAIRPHTRFVHFPKHRHNYVEAIYMCEGTTTHIIDGERLVLRQGELLLLSQSAVQEILPAAETDVAVNFIITTPFFDTALRMLGDSGNLISEFLLGCLDGGGRVGYILFRVADVLPVQNLIENLIWSLVNRQPNRRSVNQVTMGLLFMQLLGCADRVEAGGGEEQDVYIRVLDYIDHNYRSGTLAELAAELHYDVYALSRMIKHLSGMNYTELVQKRRMSQACWLLRNTRLTVESIAENVGYENKSYFYRKFVERIGMTPAHYRCGRDKEDENAAF